MEEFYGEPTLQHLIEHTRDLIELLSDYEDVYSLAMPLENLEGEEYFDENEEEKSQEEIHSKDVFYAGTRKRDN